MRMQTLRAAREDAKLTQDELASLSGVAQATISSIERGTRPNPTIDTVERLAKALGIAPSNLRFSDPQPDGTLDRASDREGPSLPDEVSR